MTRTEIAYLSFRSRAQSRELYGYHVFLWRWWRRGGLPAFLAVALSGCASIAENYQRIKAEDAAAQVLADTVICRGFGYQTQDALAACVDHQSELRQQRVDRIVDRIADDLMRRR
jgi:hypothetical protein